VAVDHVREPRVAPTECQVRGCVALAAEPGERRAQDRLGGVAADPGEEVLVVVELTVERAGARRRYAEEGEAAGLPVDGVDAGEGLEAAPPQGGALRRRGVREEAAALVRRDVLRDL